MPIELAVAAVASFLAPIVTKGLEAVVQQLGQSLGESTAASTTEKARTVWGRLKDRLSGSGDVTMLKELERDPENETVRRMLEGRVREEVEQDETLRDDLTEVVAALTAKPSSEFTVTHMGEGDVNTVYMPNADFRKSNRATVGARVEVHEASKDRTQET